MYVVTQDLLREEPKLTQLAFSRLLEWLDDGLDSQGGTYLEMRRRLVSYFDRRNRPFPDELADETFNRIARTLEKSGAIAVTPPARYCYVVARFVLLEDLRRGRRHVPVNEARTAAPIASAVSLEPDGSASIREQRLDCLDRCLQKLKPEQRELAIEYYRDARRERIERRRALAARLGITMNALGVRACRNPEHARDLRGRLLPEAVKGFRASRPIEKGVLPQGADMPVPREWDEYEQQLVRYLLGLLSEDEAERLDEASVVDAEVALRLRQTEHELIDAYVSGTLDAQTHSRFEAFYLASPLRRQKVEFARRFLTLVDRVSTVRSGTALRQPDKDDLRRWRCPGLGERIALRSKFARPPVAAASLLLACGILVFETQQLQEALDRTQGLAGTHTAHARQASFCQPGSSRPRSTGQLRLPSST